MVLMNLANWHRGPVDVEVSPTAPGEVRVRLVTGDHRVVAGRRGEREGSMIGTRYGHMTEAMQARVVGVIAKRLAVALIEAVA